MSSSSTSTTTSYAVAGRIMLISLVVFFAVLLALLFTHLYCRWRLLTRNHPLLSSPARRGLDPALLKTLPLTLFSTTSAFEENSLSTDCSVCLTEFQEGEKVRQLPHCRHCFHLDCIDVWFQANSTCPLCRSTVEFKDDDVAPEDDGMVTSVGEVRVEVGEGASSSGNGEEVKSPAMGMVLLRRILSLDVRVCRTESELERAVARRAESLPASPRPSRPPEAEL